MRAELLAKQGGVYSREPSRRVMLREREIFRLWWHANEKALLAERPQDLKPGEHYQPERHGDDEDPMKARRIELKPKPNPQATPHLVEHAPIAETVAKPTRNYAILGAFAAILAAIVLMFRKRLLRK